MAEPLGRGGGGNGSGSGGKNGSGDAGRGVPFWPGSGRSRKNGPKVFGGHGALKRPAGLRWPHGSAKRR